MSRLGDILNNLAEAKILTKDITITTGNSQYDGYYYADLFGVVPDGYVPLSAGVVNTQSGTATNVYATCSFIGRSVRVWTVRANTAVSLRVSYKLGGVVKQLLSKLVDIFSMRGGVCCE